MILEKQKLSNAECIEILETCETGILATKGSDAFPYAVPVNYVLGNGKIYIHGRSDGTKIQNIEADAHVAFCVIERAALLPEEYTTAYRSVIVYGTAKLLTTREEKHSAMQLLMNRLAPGIRPSCMEALACTDDPGLGIIQITPIRITGKHASG